MNRLLAPPSHRPATATAATPLVLQPVRQPAIPPRLLTPGRMHIGSDSACDVCLRVAGVAERHAVVVVTPQCVSVQTVDPRTWVNDWPIKESKLRLGDRLAIGPVIFQVRAATTDEILQQLPASPDATARENADAEPSPPTSTPKPIIEPEEPLPWVPAEEHLAVPSTECLGEWLSAAEMGGIEAHGIAQRPWFLDVWSTPVADGEELPVDAANRRRAEEALELLAKLQEERAAWEQEQLERDRQRVAWDQEQHGWEEQREAWEQNQRAQDERLAAWDEQCRERDEERARWNQERAAQQERRDAWSLEQQERTRQFDDREQALTQRGAQLDQLQQELQRRHDEQLEYVTRWKQQQEEWQKRQVDLLDLQQRLRTERDQLEQLVGQVRAELSAETAGQSAAWSEWQTVHARLTAELTVRFSEVDARRAELSSRAAALESEQSTLAVARAQLDADRDALTEERRRWAEARNAIDADTAALRDDLRRQEGQFVSAVHDRAQSQAEFLAARRELQHERRLFAEQQAAWLQERDSLWNELSERRRQLEQEFGALEHQHLQLGQLIVSLEQELSGVHFEREDLKTERLRLQAERDALAETRAELCDAQSRYDESRQDFDAESAGWHEELRKEQAQLVADRQQYEQAHAELLAAHQDLQRERRRFAEEREEWIQERDAECEELASVQQQLDDQLAAAESQHAELDRLRESLGREFAAVAQEREQLRLHKLQLETPPPPQPPVVEAAAAQPPVEVVAVAEPSTDPEGPITEAASVPPDQPEPEPSVVSESIESPQPLHDDLDQRVEMTAIAAATTVDESTPSPLQVDLSADGIPSSLPIELRAGGDAEKPIHDSVNSLRAELARLFNLPEDQIGEDELTAGEDSARSEATPFTAPDGEPAIDPETTPDSSVEESSGWRERLQSLFEPSALLASARSGVDDDSSNPSPSQADDSASERSQTAFPEREEESISSYMERLLARTKRTADAPAGDGRGLLPRTAEETWFRNAVDGAEERGDCETEAPPVNRPLLTTPDPSDVSYLDLAPTHSQDKNEVRANLQSFRQVANLSARTALRKHGWRTLRSEIVAHAIMASISAAGAAAYFGGPAWGGPVQWLPGSACLIAAAWTFRQWCLSLRHLKPWKHNRRVPTKTRPANAPTDVATADEPASEPPAELERSLDVEPTAVGEAVIPSASAAPEFSAASLAE